MAATNVISEKIGKFVLDDVFEKHKKSFDRYSRHKANESQEGMTAEEMDQILAEAAKPLALFHEAAQRKTGAYPKVLAELVPEFMPAVPEDPYAKGKGLKYDVSRGIIWTVGAEGSFNGETVKPRADGKYDSYGKYGRENRNYVRNIDGTPAK